jgi:hypothetical protein
MPLEPHDLCNDRVKIVETNDYVSLRGEPLNLKDKKLGFYGRAEAKVQILDEVTLFGRYNTDQIRDDTNPDGVEINDIDQGSIGDCYFGAAVAALAFRVPDFVHDDLFVVKPDGTVSVYFFPVLDQEGEAAQEVNIEVTLDKGWNQAQLSGDRADGYGQGAYEVWTIALEKAYGQFIGWSDLIDGGTAADVWDHITGEPANTDDADEYTNEELVNMIRSAFDSGQKVALGTRDLPGDKKKESWPLSNGKTLSEDHEYVVTGHNDSTQEFKLYNPWGPVKLDDVPWLPFQDVKTVIARIYTQ